MMRRAVSGWFALCFLVASGGAIAAAELPDDFKPVVGQVGRDVIWVPTEHSLVEKMLDMAKVTPQDFVIDLGSGDGRNVIAAAQRGARALGVEYERNMVEYSRRLAVRAGVSDKAEFVQGDMYEADISKATVLALFLLPDNLDQLAPKLLALAPGTRIVLNTFLVTGWEPDEKGKADDPCEDYCTAFLYYVPAQVAGTWRLPQGELHLAQKFQMVTGRLATPEAVIPVENGRLRGDEISFTAGGVQYVGRVQGDAMRGTRGGAGGPWRAVREGAPAQAESAAPQSGG